jgi:N-acyl-D-aspartate/D-glutamate deacylase
MRAELRDGLRAGAVGFTTSRTHNHQTADDRPVASRVANWDEVCALVDVMREENTGVFELANEDVMGEQVPPYIDKLLDLAVSCGRPVTWGIGSSRHLPGAFRVWTDGLERIARAGGRAFGMVHARPFNVVLGFRTRLPFDSLPVWSELRTLPLEQQAAALRDPSTRKRLVEIAKHGPYREAVGTEARKPDYDWIFPLLDPVAQGPSVQAIAAQRGADPDETFLDLALESNLDVMFLQPFANEDQEHVLELMRNPRTVVTFSDSGAHVSQIMDSSIPTHVLAHWTREREALTLEQAVRMLTFEPASAWGFADRGLLREGLAADLVVFDPARVAPRMPELVADLPGGCQRLLQRADGFAASVVAGRTILRNGEPTGAHPGRVLGTGVNA